ncbi:hypothetical protein AB0F68_00055 [Micromonospora sp. NPDC023966]|uniref:hypothetical protein n=1 Tax=Micromonospora sp. NPDC023966 TaxID=3154699 RepID=UPI0033E855F8
MGTLIINDFSFEEHGPVLSVGLAESADESGRDLIFQCDLRHNSYPAESNWPEGETYCVTDTWGRTGYGGVTEASFRGRVLRMVFNEKTTRVLGLEEPSWELVISDALANVDELRRQLERVLSCGRPEYRPRVFDFGE